MKQPNPLPPGISVHDRFTLSIQLCESCEEPEKNVRVHVTKLGYLLELPKNYPSIHDLTWSDLVALTIDKRIFDLSTTHNNKIDNSAQIPYQ